MSESKDIESLMRTVEQAEQVYAAHAEGCTQAPCIRCRRARCQLCGGVYQSSGLLNGDEPRCPGCQAKAEATEWRAGALSTLPRAFAGATLAADWLAALVGATDIGRAAKALGAERVAFVGMPGTGKTSLAVAMFRAALESERAPTTTGWTPTYRPRGWQPARHLYISAFALAKAQSISPMGEEAPVITRAIEAPLVLIDELGGEDPRYASAVKEVIYERHANARPTWITTGVGAKEVAQRYGGGISRKAFEDAVVFGLGRK